MTPQEISTAVRTYFRAYETNDRNLMEGLLAADFTFSSPYDDHISRDVYFERCWPNAERIRSYTFENIAADGSQAFIRYVLTLKDGPQFHNTELFTLKDGKISSVEVYFGSFRTGGEIEKEISHVVAARADAIRQKDPEALLALYAAEIVSFDVIDPLFNKGLGEIGARLENWLSAYEGPFGCEVRDLQIHAYGTAGFAHSLHRFYGTMKDGTKIDMWVRDTLGLRNDGGSWKIVHEHMSEPFNPETGLASLGLKPAA